MKNMMMVMSMTEKRFVGEEDSDYIRDNKTDERALYLCDWLNKLNGLSDENEQLKQDIGYLEEKIKENEWHWNTIDEDRDVWHYKYTEAEKRVEELKEENEELKKDVEYWKQVASQYSNELNVFEHCKKHKTECKDIYWSSD